MKLVVAPGVTLFKAHAGAEVLEATLGVLAAAPPRRMVTPWGKPMSVEMTSCGACGWVTDRKGYRYSPTDPITGQPWPALPQAFLDTAAAAAEEAGFPSFRPVTALVNRYDPSAKMGLHQDRDEGDVAQPIVSFSFGLSARFRLGGTERGDPTLSLVLDHGDVLVFGGPARLAYHGIDRILPGAAHPRVGAHRLNVTLRFVRSAAATDCH